MESLSIIKIGGSILENDIELDNFLKNFAMIEGKKILVHGGGKEGDKWLKKMDIKPNFVNGRRITDKETIDVVTSIYGGLINKKLTSKLQKYNDSFIGLSGIDGNITESEKRKNKKEEKMLTNSDGKNSDGYFFFCLCEHVQSPDSGTHLREPALLIRRTQTPDLFGFSR